MNLLKQEALLITSKPNIYYFSGIDAESGVFLFLTKTKKFVCTDARFIASVARIAKEFIPVATDKKSRVWWHNLLKKNKIKTIYFELRGLTYYSLNKFRRMSRGVAQLKASKLDLQKLRSLKLLKELKYLKRSASIASQIMGEAAKLIKDPASFGKLSEIDITLAIHKQALNRDCFNLAFPPIVAFGKNTGVPHHQASKFRRLKRGDMVLIDLGVKYQNYCSDITRTFFTAPPTTRQAEIYNKVLKAQTSTIKKIRPGIRASNLVQNVINYFGNETPHFTHGLGHGVGLEIHEQPNLKLESSDTLRANQVITIEPGLYFSWGGVRIEDTLIIGKNTNKVITTAPKTALD